MEQCIKDAFEVKSRSIVANLKRRQMQGFICMSLAQTREKILELIPPHSSVSWGDSLSLEAIGIKTVLREGQYILFDRDSAKSVEERVEIMRHGMGADFYLTGTNAITLDGELVNIDGRGNRCAALCFGPQTVIILASMKKIVTTRDAAICRIKSAACPENALRHHFGTPCAITGKCAECLSKDCMCGQILVTRFSKVPDRIKVLLIAEDIGL